MDKQQLKNRVCGAIDTHRDRIIDLGETIMDNPELGFKEVQTAERVKETFQETGLPFQDRLGVTGIKAVLRGKRPGPTVALMGELDALIVPDHPRADRRTGAAHACGHNAQIAGLMGAVWGLSTAPITDHLSGNIVFLAVPAEEYVEIDYRLGLVKEGTTSFLCGKQELIRLGAFDDVDLAIMIHATSSQMTDGKIGTSISSNGFLAKNIRFLGRAAHSGVAPEQGINALNAATLALSAIHAQRETFRDQDCVRVHPILTKGGDLVNIVPAEVRMETYVRARSADAILDASRKVDRALRGAAVAMGCRVEIETVPGNLPLYNDSGLAEIFRENAEQFFGEGSCRQYPHAGGSTDAGDLSHLIPVLHPYMCGGHGQVHTTQWHITDVESGYVAPAKTLAMMAIDLLADDANRAHHLLGQFRPSLSKEEYLRQQQAVFHTEKFDGAAWAGRP